MREGGKTGGGRSLINLKNKTAKYLFIVLSVVILLGVITSFFLSQSNATKAKQEMEKEGSTSSNLSMKNNSQNMNNTSKNIISIPLEKPPFIKD